MSMYDIYSICLHIKSSFPEGMLTTKCRLQFLLSKVTIDFVWIVLSHFNSSSVVVGTCSLFSTIVLISTGLVRFDFFQVSNCLNIIIFI